MKLLFTAVLVTLTFSVRVSAAPIDMIPAPNNIAFGAMATANQGLWNNDTPSKLTDGILANQVHGTNIAPTDGFAYTIDLGATQTFSSIDIYPRQDGCCPDRLKDVHLAVHDDDGGVIGGEVWSADIFQGLDADPPTTSGAVHSFEETDGAGTFNGRFITVTSNQSPVEQYDLQIAEIEVQATTGAMVPKNHAFLAPVTASGPTWNDTTQAAARITDGIRGGNSISHPAASENVGVGNPSNGFSYTIELPNPVEIDNINVVGRGDNCCPERLLNYRIEVFDADPATGAPLPLFTEDKLIVPPMDIENARVDNYAAIDKTGQWVKITNLSDADFSPQIAEVEVFGRAITTPDRIPGDINDDDMVDEADVTEFVKWFGTVGAFSDFTTGDFNDDDKTSLADLLLLKQHFGESIQPSPTAVPEPSTILLLLASMLSLGIYGWRRK